MFSRHFVIVAVMASVIGFGWQADRLNASQPTEPHSQPLKVNQLRNLLDAFFEDLQRSSPEFSTYVGATNAHDDRWSEHTEEAYCATQRMFEKYLDLVHAIDFYGLSRADQINYRLMERYCEEAIEGYTYEMHYMPLDQLGGIPLDVEYVFQTMPRNSKSDYENIISRLRGIPVLIDQTMALMEKGVEKGITPPQVTLRTLPNSIERMTPVAVEDSIFFDSFTYFPETVKETDRDELAARARLLIADEVYPAYKKLHAYLKTTYVPSCRQTSGANLLPNGYAWYDYCVRKQTTTAMTPWQIHELGLAEVSRIKTEMEMMIAQTEFEGTLKEFFTYFNSDPKFFFTNADDLLNEYRAITHQIDVKLPRLFGKIPSLPYEVVATPAHSEESQVGAYYMRGSTTTGRPGRFYVNTYDIGTRPKWQMESLALHEAVPGHHFQISLAQEIKGLPDFRKYTGYTAYIEGWGLYSEGLGRELGLYKNPTSYIGRLIEEIWRAVRLVVDTGIHAFGWSRDEAIDYFIKHTGMGEREATTEVDRYIVWPGQALAYKIGELSIKRWRQEAQDALGESFNIRAFHDTLLEQGALPLDICEQQMHAWIDDQRVNPRKPL